MLAISTTPCRRRPLLRGLRSARVGANAPLSDGFWTLDEHGATWLARRLSTGSWSATTTQYGPTPSVSAGGSSADDVLTNVKKYTTTNTPLDDRKPISTMGYDFKETGGAALPTDASAGSDGFGAGTLVIGAVGAGLLVYMLRK